MKILKIFTKSCSQCKVLDRNLKAAGIDYISMDAENEAYADILEKYDIKHVPTLLLLDDNDNLIKKNVGILTVSGINEFVKQIT